MTVDKTKKPGTRKDCVTDLLNKLQGKLIVSEKISIGDYIKLAELEHTLGAREGGDRPKELRVKWVEPDRVSETDR